MSATPFSPRQNARREGGLQALPTLVVVALVVAAIGFIAYVLWPRWPGPAISPGSPPLPITVAGTRFNVPPAAIRVSVQRRSGAHERVDLAFLWPSLEPADPKSLMPPPGAAAAAAKTLERVFLTITAAGDTLPPAERVKTIYSRYAASEPVAGPDGLAVLAFRDGTPYQGEDLVYDAAKPDRFLLRCSRTSAGPTPGTCLLNLRI